MDLSSQLIALLTSLGVPVIWVVPLSVVIGFLVKKYLPNLPSMPFINPKPTPTPTPTPDVPLLSDRPLLNSLLSLLTKLRSGTPLSVEEKAIADVIVKELAPDGTSK